MNQREAFKIGFLEKCAEDGLTPQETLLRIENATFMLKTSGDVTGISGLLQNVFNKAWPLALIAPAALGTAAGAMLARAPDDTYDEGELHKREEITEYQHAVEQLQRQLRRRQ